MIEKKLIYQHKIIKELYFSNALSCLDLSLNIDKSLPVTTKVLNDLISEGIVLETGFATSTGGRRPLMYSMKPDVLNIVAVAMDQFVTRIAIMDLQNKLITKVENFELSLAGNPDALSFLAQKINEIIDQSGISRAKIAGIGIGMPGFVDLKKGINYTFLPVTHGSITSYIANETGIPAYIDNDSSLIALAELRFGAAIGKKNAMVVNIGWGIGLGMIFNGELFRGHNGFAGEFSHIPLFLNGKQCSCGKFGCLETETSLLVIIDKLKEGLKSGRLSGLKSLSASDFGQFEKTFELISEAAWKGDQFVIELFSEAGYEIGRGVAILIHLLNPELVVLSGRGSVIGKIWQAPVQQSINEHCIPHLSANTTIEISTLGYRAELIGAAALVMENYEQVKSNNEYTSKAQSVS